MKRVRFNKFTREVNRVLGELPDDHWTTCYLCMFPPSKCGKHPVGKSIMKIYENYYSFAQNCNEIMMSTNLASYFETEVRRPFNEGLESLRVQRVVEFYRKHRLENDTPPEEFASDAQRQEYEDIEALFEEKKIKEQRARVFLEHFRRHTGDMANCLLARIRELKEYNEDLRDKLHVEMEDSPGEDNMDLDVHKSLVLNAAATDRLFALQPKNQFFQANPDVERMIRTSVAGSSLLASSAMSTNVQQGQVAAVALFTDGLS